MANLPRSQKITWLVATTRRERVVVISKIRFWVSHWDVQAGKSRRCGGDTCLLCSMGLPKVFRYVCLVVDRMGNQRLLELRERHLGLLELLRNQTRGELGSVLNVKKTGEAKNSPVEITSSDQEQVIEQDISRLVESLGLVARHISEEQIEEDAAVNAKLEEVQSRMSAQFNVN